MRDGDSETLVHSFHLKLLSSYALVFTLFYVNKLELRLPMKAPLIV